jgi:hypothetical protein
VSYEVKAALSLKINKVQLDRLQAAAQHRGMKVEELCSQIVVGVVTRGSIDKQLRLYHAYNLDRSGGDAARELQNRKRRAERAAQRLANTNTAIVE